MTDLDVMSQEERDQFSLEAKAEVQKIRKQENKDKKAVIRMIEAQWARCTRWKNTVDPEATSKLDKYSVAKLNGFDKCKDVISHCVSMFDRQTFEDMMSDSVTVETFCEKYQIELL